MGAVNHADEAVPVRVGELLGLRPLERMAPRREPGVQKKVEVVPPRRGVSG